AWALILAITLYPLHRSLARKIGGRQGLAATIVVISGGLLIVTPTALLMNSFGSSIHDFVSAVQHNTLEIPAPRKGIEEWPIVGRERGGSFARLSTATIRAVAQGVIGIAFVQATLVGLALVVAGVPWAGVLAAITLVLSVAQVPALIVILPSIGYIWSSGNYSN